MQLIYLRIPTIVFYLCTIRLKNIINISNVSGASQCLLGNWKRRFSVFV